MTLEPPNLERDYRDLVIRMAQTPEWNQVRKYIQAETDDLRAAEIAKSLGRAFYADLTAGIIKS